MSLPGTQNPLFLQEATVSLYVQAAPGNINGQPPVYFGALARVLVLRQALRELLSASSGDLYQRAYHVDETITIQIERLWLVSIGLGQDFYFKRNTQSALDLLWSSGGQWHRRLYYGVTGQSESWLSRRTLDFTLAQEMRAQYFVTSGGSDPSAALASPPPGPSTSAGFYSDDALFAGIYLLGSFRWFQSVTLVSAAVIADAPQVSPVTVGLEVAGTLTAMTLVIPVGTVGARSSASAAVGLTISPGSDLRWKVLSGPSAMNTAGGAALSMQVQATATMEEAVAFPPEGILLPPGFVCGTYRWASNMVVTGATVTAFAGNSPTTLVLVVGGVATDTTLCLPAGTANTE